MQAHLNDYENIISHISTQGMTIDDELKALLLMSNLSHSWETFITTVCNGLCRVVKYSEIASSVLSEDAKRKTFVHESASDAFIIQSLANRLNNRGGSSS